MKKINLKSLVRPRFFWGGSIIFLLVISITFYILQEKEMKTRVFTQKQLIRTIESEKVVANNLIETIKAKEIVEEEFAAEKKRSLALEKEVEGKDRQMQLTLDKLEKEIASRHKVEDQLVIVMKEKKVLEAKVTRFSETPRKAIELEKIVVKSVPGLTGEVLVANKEHAFIVVNLGRADNLRLGDILSVYRNDKFIGRAQVQRMEEKMTAATVLPDWEDVEFKENDKVRKL